MVIVGDKVKITRNDGSWLFEAIWWPAEGCTGVVTKVCKNGAVYVALDQFRNNSEDGKLTRVFPLSDNVTITKL